MKQLLTAPESDSQTVLSSRRKRTYFSQDGQLNIYKWKIRKENSTEWHSGHSQIFHKYRLEYSKSREFHPTSSEKCRFSLPALALRCPGDEAIRTLIENGNPDFLVRLTYN